MESPFNDEITQRIAWFDANFAEVTERIARAAREAGRDPAEITLLAATKTVPVEVINHAIAAGVPLIGENRVQELCAKWDALDKSVPAHHIGRLQTNKVKMIVGKVAMIESVDSLHLAEEIARRSQALGITTDMLVEINIGGEEAKSGVLPEKAEELLCAIAPLEGVRVRGLMAIPPICENQAQISRYFEKMYKLFIDFSAKNIDNITMEQLSMGMSGDYEAAIRSGATIVRLGTALFGARYYR
ncbi:MAG: YggS family pyridoxal phosphate-dependent enzyme [Clostridia bacterium]|nr:YggS family pyridoxal phosphate-dependent enzyme [Clostridia bacterium]